MKKMKVARGTARAERRQNMAAFRKHQIARRAELASRVKISVFFKDGRVYHF